MKDVTTTPELSHSTTESDSHLFDDWFDPIETGIRDRVRGLIEEMIRGELDAVLSRPRYGRQARHADGSDAAAGIAGHRHGSRARTLMGTFGKTEINVPRARLNTCDGKTTEWKSQGLRSYQRRTLAADALIAGTYLAGTNTRRVRRALGALFGGAVGKDTVSRVWRKVKGDWDAWNARSLADEPIVRLTLDGTVVRVRLDRKATSISARRPGRARRRPEGSPGDQARRRFLLPMRLSPQNSKSFWHGLQDDGHRDRRASVSRRTFSRSRSCARIIHGAPLQSCWAGKVPSRSIRNIVEGLTDKAVAASLSVTSPRSGRSPSR
jgi:hypothetical protein